MKHPIAVAYHSGFGHTQKVAEAIASGAQAQGNTVSLIAVDSMTDAHWALLDEAAAIVFGAPTYMGGVSAEYKRFMDESSKRWLNQRWKDKIAGGFTNSGAYSGDKLATLTHLAIFATQHSMIWVGTGLPCPTGRAEPGPEDINRLGSFLGVMTFATSASPEVTPPSGDLETARLYGSRIASVTNTFTSS